MADVPADGKRRPYGRGTMTVAEYNREWRRKNPTKCAEASRRWRENNPATALATREGHKKRNPGYSAKSSARWRSKNPERSRQHCAQWERRNPHIGAAKTAKHRAATLQATPTWVDHEIIELVYAEAAHRGLTVDHVIPLQGKTVCGLHVHYNMQLLSKAENSRKGIRL